MPANIKAVLFDLHGTLAYAEDNEIETEISDYLFSKGYEISPQQLRSAWSFVSFIDYPRYGYKSWHTFFKRIFWRLKVKADKETLNTIIKLLESKPYQLHSDAAEAVIKAKRNGFKTAIVTTIACFQFKKAVRPIRKYIDFVMTGFEAGCDKTNPKMYRKVLKILNVKPEEAIMVGDNASIDVVLPKKLGINAILLDREGKNAEYQDAVAVVSNLNEAIETIIRKFGRN